MTRTVFSNASIFDGTGSPFADGDVLVENGRIVDVGSGFEGDELVDLNGRLFVNLNDSAGRGPLKLIRRIVKGFRESYLLNISGNSEADMSNFFDEDGNRIPPKRQSGPKGIGYGQSQFADYLGVNHVIPFSSFHSMFMSRVLVPYLRSSAARRSRIASNSSSPTWNAK